MATINNDQHSSAYVIVEDAIREKKNELLNRKHVTIKIDKVSDINEDWYGQRIKKS